MSARKKKPTTWQRLSSVECDLCSAPAVWKHPLGGLRCSDCPRPEPDAGSRTVEKKT